MTTKMILKEASEKISQIEGVPVTVYFKKRNTVSIRLIKEAVCAECGVTWEQVMARDRHEPINTARQLFSYFCMTKLPVGCVFISKYLQRNHASVISHRRKVSALLVIKDEIMTNLVFNIENRL